MKKNVYIEPICEVFQIITNGQFMDETFSVFDEETEIVGAREIDFDDGENERSHSINRNLWDD